jgi:hypothetical protein
LLFKKLEADMEAGKRYLVTATNVRLLDEIVLRNKVVFSGNLIRHGCKNLGFGEVFLHEYDSSENMAVYKEFVVVDIADVEALTELAPTELVFNSPYRVQLVEKDEANRKNLWLSCRFVGQTLSGCLLFLDYSEHKAIIMLRQDEIKSIFSMSVAEIEPLDEEILEKELSDEA